MQLADLVPDVDLLLLLSPEQVGKQLLRLALERVQNGIFHKDGTAGASSLFEENYGPLGISSAYAHHRRPEILLAVGEAWQWLEHAGLIMPAASPNETYSRLTRRGAALAANPEAFDDFVVSSAFPKSLIHPAIADEVWIQLSQGKLDVAVFVAFRAVEEAVREAANFDGSDHGVPMMRRAFNKDSGPLRKVDDPEAEREALSSLFSGALGSYKNPHSHRSVGLDDPQEAHEMIMLASHLLRIVEDRRQSNSEA